MLLVCVMADGQAAQLVAHARLLHSATDGPWRVVYLDTVASQLASARVRADVELALRQAHDNGAEVERISLGVDSASHLISTIVHQARHVGARRIVLGSHATGRRFWANFGERLSDFSEVLAASVPNAQIHIVVAPGREAPPARVLRAGGLDTVERAGAPRHWLLPLGVLLLCTLVGLAISHRLHPINVLLVFLLGVLFVALRRGLVAAVVMALASVLVFDWIFVEPRWSLKPTDPEYFFTFAILLCVGLAVGQLAARSREAGMRALELANRAQALSLLSQNLARARAAPDIAQTLALAVERGLGARAEVSLESQPPPATSAAEGSAVFELNAGGVRHGTLAVHGLPPEHREAEDLHLLQAFAHQAAVALERTRFERQSAQAAVEAETERVRNTLLAGISHDFRTPLTTIIGAATTVLTQGAQISTAERDALARNVLEQAQRLQSLTSDLLDLARLQDGAVRPSCEWCPVDELVQDALAPIRERLSEHPLDVQANADDIVWCDARLATQALSNLVLNAAQHSPPQGRITVAVVLQASRWRLIVRDQGPGLQPGGEQAVFRKFHRSPTAHGGEGTGLGLAICEVVARLHGGGISAHNDRGAVFEMWFEQPPKDPPAWEKALG